MANSGRNIEEVYELGKVIGSGQFAKVHVGYSTESNEQVAIKIIQKNAAGLSSQEKMTLEKEIAILKTVDHPNIIRLHDVFDTPRHLYIVMEMARGGELFDCIVEKKKYSEPDAATLIVNVVDAVLYLHSIGIVHRDLKPENLLLVKHDDDCEIKVSDFGLAKLFQDGTSAQVCKTICGSPGYVAPEILFNRPYNESCDFWSIGVILYILLCGFPPFYGPEAKQYDMIMRGRYSFPARYWETVSEDAKDLVRKLLVVDPARRLDGNGILNHTWIKKSARASKA